MTVKELIEKLNKMPQDAIVCVETWSDPKAKLVRGYTDGENQYVYIGDDFDNLDWDFEDQGFEVIL